MAVLFDFQTPQGVSPLHAFFLRYLVCSRLFFGLIPCLGLAVFFLLADRLLAQRPHISTGESSEQLWISSNPLPDGRQMLMVMDPKIRTLAVYHVDPVEGVLTLRSTRDLTWDLLVPEFNAREPLPGDLKKMLETPVEKGLRP